MRARWLLLGEDSCSLRPLSSCLISLRRIWWDTILKFPFFGPTLLQSGQKMDFYLYDELQICPHWGLWGCDQALKRVPETTQDPLPLPPLNSDRWGQHACPPCDWCARTAYAVASGLGRGWPARLIMGTRLNGRQSPWQRTAPAL